MNNKHFYLSLDLFNSFAYAYNYLVLVLWNEYRFPSRPVL